MATKKAERPAKAKPRLEPIGDDKVRLTVEFYIEELVKRVTWGGVIRGCSCGPAKVGNEGCSGCHGCAGSP